MDTPFERALLVVTMSATFGLLADWLFMLILQLIEEERTS